MDSDFWLQRWKKNEIGFHEEHVNQMLAEYFESLKLSKGERLFVPLCGKTSAIAWLLTQGYRVVGVELSELAIRQLFDALQITARLEFSNEFKCFRGDNIEIFVGDFFSLSSDLLGNIAATYDRAALIALPTDLRVKYASHLIRITQQAPILLNTYRYDQETMQGPPFSVPEPEIKKLFGEFYTSALLAAKPTPEKLKNRCRPIEELRLLEPRY